MTLRSLVMLLLVAVPAVAQTPSPPNPLPSCTPVTDLDLDTTPRTVSQCAALLAADDRDYEVVIVQRKDRHQNTPVIAQHPGAGFELTDGQGVHLMVDPLGIDEDGNPWLWVSVIEFIVIFGLIVKISRTPRSS